VPLAELPSNGAASQDDFPTQRQLARHLSRHFGPVATLRDLPAGDQLPPMVAAQARGRAAGQIPYATGLTAGTTWRRDQHGAFLDPTRKLHYRPMAALFHLWVPPAARIRRDELALTLCQWAGMTVEPARTNGKFVVAQRLVAQPLGCLWAEHAIANSLRSPITNKPIFAVFSSNWTFLAQKHFEN